MFCEKCGDYMALRKTCNCKLFSIIDEDGEDYEVYGYDAHDAAIKYAKSSNENCDYYLMNDSVEIIVNGIKFNISAEPDVYYSASEVK